MSPELDWENQGAAIDSKENLTQGISGVWSQDFLLLNVMQILTIPTT